MKKLNDKAAAKKIASDARNKTQMLVLHGDDNPAVVDVSAKTDNNNSDLVQVFSNDLGASKNAGTLDQIEDLYDEAIANREYGVTSPSVIPEAKLVSVIEDSDEQNATPSHLAINQSSNQIMHASALSMNSG